MLSIVLTQNYVTIRVKAVQKRIVSAKAQESACTFLQWQAMESGGNVITEVRELRVGIRVARLSVCMASKKARE